MNSKPRDRQTHQAIDPDLEPIRSAWQELEQAEPPQLLDQAVLNSARRQLERPANYRRRRWVGAFATAAVMVMALMLVVRQDQYAPPAPVPAGDGFRLEKGAAAQENGGQAMKVERSAAAPEMLQRTDPDITAASDEPHAESAQQDREVSEALGEETSVLDPAAWIEQMLELREAGRMEELEAELASFRRAFPDYPLPAQLAD